jgi:PEP-CTERM motif
MKLSKPLWILAALLLLTPLAQADGTTTIQFTGVNGANNGVYYVSPYTGTLNYGTSSAQTVVLFCVDINNDVSMNQVWNANVTSLASGNFSNTRYGNGSVNPNLGGMNPQTLYEEAAWLTTQFSSHSGDYVSLQYALWDLMTPGAEPTNYANADGTTVAQWLALAAANYGQINPASFVIATNTGALAYTGQVQEFIVQTPEPTTGVLLLFGLASMFLLFRRSQQLLA